MTPWKTIPDKLIRHVWELVCGCQPEEGIARMTEDNNEELAEGQVSVQPSSYADCGTPICAKCGADLGYCRTEMKEK